MEYLLITFFIINLYLVVKILGKNKIDYALASVLVFLSFPYIYKLNIPKRVVGIPSQYVILTIWGIKNLFTIYFLRLRKFVKPSKQIIFISLVFISYGLASFLWIKNYSSWFIYIVQWIIYIFGIMLAAPSIFNNREKLNKFIKIYITALTFSNTFGLYNFFVLKLSSANAFLLINRNATIFIIAPLIPLIVTSGTMFKKNQFIFILLINTLALLFIFSRTGYISLIITISLFILWGNYDLRKIFNKIVPLFVITLFAYLFANALTSGNLTNMIKNRFSSIVNAFNFLSSGTENAGSDYRRAGLVAEGIKIFKKNFILGTGIGLENYLYYFTSFISDKGPARAHSVYISYLAELGIIGFPILLSLFISITKEFYKTFKNNISNCYLSKGFLVGNIVILIAFFTGEHITSPFVWLFWGLGLSNSVINKEEINDKRFKN